MPGQPSILHVFAFLYHHHYNATSSHTHFAHRYGADAFAFRGGFFQIEGRPVTLDENLLTTVTGTAAKGDNTIKVGSGGGGVV